MKLHSIHIYLDTEELVHLIGFIAVAETSKVPYVKRIADKMKKVVLSKLNMVEWKEFKEAFDKCKSDIASIKMDKLKQTKGEPLILT